MLLTRSVFRYHVLIAQVQCRLLYRQLAQIRWSLAMIVYQRQLTLASLLGLCATPIQL
jgi:hypothetical protein